MRRSPALRFVSATTALVFAAWTCGPGLTAAQAASGVGLAVVGVHGNGEQDDAELRSLTNDLVAGFQAAGLDVRSGEAVGALLRPERDRVFDRVFLAPVTRAFEEGRILYEKAQPEQAIDALERAQTELQSSGEFLREGRLRVDVPLYLGLSWISLGEGERAEPAFADVVRAHPDRVLDSLDYPPNIVETFDRVRATVLAAELASIEVATHDGSPARVFLDGRLLGAAPVAVDGLPPGDHTVLLDGGTGGRYFESLDVEPGGSLAITAALERRGFARSAGDDVLPARSGFTRRLYRELAATTGADAVAVAGFDEAGDFQLALYSARSQTFSVAVSASLAAAPGARSDFVEDLAKRVASYVDDNGGIKPERVATEAVPLRLGGNPVLTDLMLGAPPGVPVTGVPVAGVVEPPAAKPKKKGPHPAGIVALIVGGLLAGAAAGVGIWAGTLPVVEPGSWAGTRPVVEPTGALVIELP